jgi:hypothetical protein
VIQDICPESPIDVELLKPRLLPGETMQGFMTSRYQPAKRSIEQFKNEHINIVKLRMLLYVLDSNEKLVHSTEMN